MLKIRLIRSGQATVLGRLLTSTQRDMQVDLSAFMNDLSINKSPLIDPVYGELQDLIDRGVVVCEMNGAPVTDLSALANVSATSGGGGGGVVQAVFSAGAFPVVVGTIPAGRTIERTVLEIQSPFNGGALFTVGDSLAVARLLSTVDSRPSKSAVYAADSIYTYGADTAVRVYLAAGTPTLGVGRALVYFS